MVKFIINLKYTIITFHLSEHNYQQMLQLHSFVKKTNIYVYLTLALKKNPSEKQLKHILKLYANHLGLLSITGPIPAQKKLRA